MTVPAQQEQPFNEWLEEFERAAKLLGSPYARALREIRRLQAERDNWEKLASAASSAVDAAEHNRRAVQAENASLKARIVALEEQLDDAEQELTQ